MNSNRRSRRRSARNPTSQCFTPSSTPYSPAIAARSSKSAAAPGLARSRRSACRSSIGLDGRGHLLGEADGGEVRVAQQVRQLPPDCQDAADQRGVVVRVVAVRVVVPVRVVQRRRLDDVAAVQLLPAVPLLAVLEERDQDRRVEADLPRAVFRGGRLGVPVRVAAFAVLVERRGGEPAERQRQARHLVRPDDLRVRLGRIEDVVAELRRQLRGLLRERVEPLLVFALQRHAGQFRPEDFLRDDPPPDAGQVRPLRPVPQGDEGVVDRAGLSDPQAEPDDGRLHGGMGLAEFRAVLHAHQVPDRPPDPLERLEQPVGGLDGGGVGRLHVGLQPVEPGGGVFEQFFHRRPDGLRRDRVEPGQVPGVSRRGVVVGRVGERFRHGGMVSGGRPPGK